MRKNFKDNPINYILQTQYDQTEAQLDKFYKLCIQEVSKLRTNRGSAQLVEKLLESNYPKIQTHFPIVNWQQRAPGKNKSYNLITVRKDFLTSLNAYVKSVIKQVDRPNSFTSLYQKFNIDPQETVSTVSTVNLDNETVQILQFALANGAKLFRKGDLEIQF
jgi:hypothetical protein